MMDSHVPSEAVGSISTAADVHLITGGSALSEAEDGPQVVPHEQMMMPLRPFATRQRLDDPDGRVALEEGDVTMLFPSFCSDHLPPGSREELAGQILEAAASGLPGSERPVTVRPSDRPRPPQPRALTPGPEILHDVLWPDGGCHSEAPWRRIVAVDLRMPGKLKVSLHQRQQREGPLQLAGH